MALLPPQEVRIQTSAKLASAPARPFRGDSSALNTPRPAIRSPIGQRRGKEVGPVRGVNPGGNEFDARAVVVTVTVASMGESSEGKTEAGAALHVAPRGAP